MQTAVSHMLKGREVLCSVMLRQGISNVPMAVMLSGFTEEGARLLVGTNIGGLGTLVASSLISFQFYIKSKGANSKEYLLFFTLLNIAFLVLLLPIVPLKIQIV